MDSRHGDTGGAPGSTADTGPESLASTLVTYADGPDRRTVFPRGLSSVARMSIWFTADDDAFLDLDEMR